MFEWLPQDLAGARCVIAALVSAKDAAAAERIAEIAALIHARGGAAVGTVVQRRGVSRGDLPGGARRMDAPLNAATLFGTGKVRELAALVASVGATAIVVMNPLKSTQRSRLATATLAQVLSPSA